MRQHALRHFDPERRRERQANAPEYRQTWKRESQRKDKRRKPHHVMKLVLLTEKLRHRVWLETGKENDRQHDQKG